MWNRCFWGQEWTFRLCWGSWEFLFVVCSPTLPLFQANFFSLRTRRGLITSTTTSFFFQASPELSSKNYSSAAWGFTQQVPDIPTSVWLVDFCVLQLGDGAQHISVTDNDVAREVNMLQLVRDEHGLQVVCFTLDFFLVSTLLFLRPYRPRGLTVDQRRRRCEKPNPYLQTSGLIKQTECRGAVNSCLITNESNDNNNHVPFWLT